MKIKLLESLYRLRYPCQASGEVYAQRKGQLQVQDLEGGRLHALRVLHHDPYRSQHASPHDEGEV